MHHLLFLPILAASQLLDADPVTSGLQVDIGQLTLGSAAITAVIVLWKVHLRNVLDLRADRDAARAESAALYKRILDEKDELKRLLGVLVPEMSRLMPGVSGEARKDVK